MWLTLAFTSAALLGFYDAAKKKALTGNAVLPVLLLNTLFRSLFFLPMILSAEFGLGWFDHTVLATAPAHPGPRAGGSEIGHRPHFVDFRLLRHEAPSDHHRRADQRHAPRHGACRGHADLRRAAQRLPVDGRCAGLVPLFLLSRSSRREGVDFRHNVWILFIALAALMGAVSGLYDKYIMARLDPVFVQSWYNLYQFGMMSVVVGILWWPRRHATTPFHWSWAIPLISVFLSLADFAYLFALRDPDAMISVVSMVRRGSVVVSFLCGAVLFRERNLRSKAVDLAFILVGMFFLWLGSRPA